MSDSEQEEKPQKRGKKNKFEKRKHFQNSNPEQQIIEDTEKKPGEPLKTENVQNVNTKDKDGKSKPSTPINRNGRLIIRNVSFKATEDSLQKHFEGYGIIQEVKLPKRPDGKLIGCAFVQFNNVLMAKKALLSANRKPFLGRPISVDWAVPKNKYMAFIDQQRIELEEKVKVDSDSEDENGVVKPKLNLSDEVKAEVKTRMSDSEQEEKPQKRGKKDKFEKRKHFQNNNPEQQIIEDAEEKPDDPLKTENVQNVNTKDKDGKSKPSTPINRNGRLIIRNVSFKATEDSLQKHFEGYGIIQEVKLLKKPDGKLIGCAFVQFKNVPMAKKALLSANMKPFLGRPISVDWAVPKNKYMAFIDQQRIELEEKVKVESDSEDENGVVKPKLNLSDEVKSEVKSESDASGNSDSSADEMDSNDEEEDSENDEEMDDEDTVSQTSESPDKKRIQLNDAEDGCTVFVTNIPFRVDNDQLKEFAEKTGSVKYALVCVDKLTEHSRGTAFIKFQNQDDADKFLSLSPDQLRLEGQVIQPKRALCRQNVGKDNKKQIKDSRNLYLVKEGVVVAGTKAAVGVSQSDMSKRLTLERSKTQMLKNLNRFVSKYRLVVQNLPATCDDARLRQLCTDTVGKTAEIKEARVMRDLRALPSTNGKHPSKGYGFVMLTRHEDALMCLRKLNNNPTIFGPSNRPIVSFSIEDRTALNARKKRLEKSIQNNQAPNKDREQLKRKAEDSEQPTNSKKRKFEKWKKGKKNFKGNKDKIGDKADGQELKEYAGLTSKEGVPQKLRSKYKLKMQAELHKQNLKGEKKKNKNAIRRKKAMRERIKQPRMPIGKKNRK